MLLCCSASARLLCTVVTREEIYKRSTGLEASIDGNRVQDLLPDLQCNINAVDSTVTGRDQGTSEPIRFGPTALCNELHSSGQITEG